MFSVKLAVFFFFVLRAEDGIRDFHVTGVQTCALPISTVFGCIGPNQPTTSALASVVDPGDHLASVELVFVDASGAETRKRMTASGGAFEAPIGPYTGDGTITWQVVASDEAGNPSSAAGPA